MNTDNTEYLQSLLDRGGTVSFPDGFYRITKPLEIGDDTRLVCSPRVTVRLADGANCPMLVNRLKENGEPTRNLTLEGGVWDGNNVGQERAKYSHPLAKWGQAISFARTENLTLRDLTVKDPQSFGIMLTDTDGFHVRNIRFDCNCLTLNQDGVHVNGYARNGTIENISGQTNDDMVAMNSDEGLFFSENNDTENIVIDGVFGGDHGFTGVRLLSRKARMRNIVIRNVFGSYSNDAVSFTHEGKPGDDNGYFDNIVLENILAASDRRIGMGHEGLIRFQSGVRHAGTVIIRNYIRNETEDLRNVTAQIFIGENVHIDTLILEHMKQRVYNGQPQIGYFDGAEISELLFDGEKKTLSEYTALIDFDTYFWTLLRGDNVTAEPGKPDTVVRSQKIARKLHEKVTGCTMEYENAVHGNESVKRSLFSDGTSVEADFEKRSFRITFPDGKTVTEKEIYGSV